VGDRGGFGVAKPYTLTISDYSREPRRPVPMPEAIPPRSDSPTPLPLLGRGRAG
jgi:hypothetical protein